MMKQKYLSKSFVKTLYGGCACIIASLIFGCSYIDMNIMSTADQLLIDKKIINQDHFGLLVSLYFFGNSLAYILAGIALQYYSVRKIILLATLALCIGTLLLLSTNPISFGFGRFLLGSAGAFVYLSALQIVSVFSAPLYLGAAFGLVSTIGLFGGFISQGPLVMLIMQFGWGNSIIFLALIILLLGIAAFSFIRKEPSLINYDNSIELMKHTGTRKFLYNRIIWLYSAYAVLMCSPIFLLTASWGQEYLNTLNVVSPQDAATINGTIFIGIMVGAPCWGLFSGSRYYPLLMLGGSVFSAIIAFLILKTILFIPPSTIYVFYFLLGFVMSSQIIVYARVAYDYTQRQVALALGVLTTGVVCGGALMQLIFSYMLKVTTLPSALWILPLSELIAAFIALYILISARSRAKKELYLC